MPTSFKNSFINGTDIDSDELRIRPNALRFLKNLLWNVNRNSQASSTEGNNAGVLTPLESTVHITSSLSLGEGLNFCCGYKESRETNEGFVFVYNTRGNHFIYSVSGKDGSVVVVYRKADLKFRYSPEYFINETRCVVRVVTYIDHATGLETKRTFILFTDSTNTQRFICKEDSIATGFFSTSFFTPKDVVTAERPDAVEQYIKLGMAPSRKCIGIDRVPATEADKYKQNFLVDKGWQFRIKFVDIYGRESEHGHISDRFFLVTGNSCISTSSGLARCLKLTIDAGNPFVRKIVVEYRNCTSNTDLSIDSDWVEADIVDKYDESSADNWYQWAINPDYAFNATTNTFEYIFCANKLSKIISAAETTRLENPLPITSDSIGSINNGILLANNVRGYEPVPVEELDKIEFTVTGPAGTGCDYVPPRKIVTYAIIYQNPQYQGGAFSDNNARVWLDNSNNRYYFHITESGSTNAGIDVGQVFKPGITGFIGYLAGTKYVTVSTQVILYADDYTETQFGNIDPGRPYVIAQKFEFLVVPGKYKFRIASHKVSTTDDYQKTSTFVAGTAHIEATLTDAMYGNWENNNREIAIDCCNDDFIQKDYHLVIIDMYNDGDYTLEFYTYESELAKIPIENAQVGQTATTGNFYVDYTDHNGYAFARKGGNAPSIFRVFVADCLNPSRQVFTDAAFSASMGSLPVGGTRWKTKSFFSYTGTDVYPETGRRLIKGRIQYCSNPLIGIPGVPVVLSHGAFAFTDNNGEFTIIAHGKYGSYAAINDTVIISQNGTCQLVRCDSCSMCFTDFVIPYKDCFGPNRITNVGTTEAKINGSGLYGPSMGGRYGMGIMFHDWMGRTSFVQTRPSYFVDIPSLLDTKQFAYSTIGFNIGGSFEAPAWAKKMTFCITENLNYEDSMMWAIDKVEYVDGAGVVNSSVATKIRLYYESIIEYSSQNNFSVNTAWQFLATDGNNVVTGDRIEFYLKPDGTWFDVLISALVRYSKDGRYVEIDYDSNLAGIEAGTLIRLVRPRRDISTNLYFELCPVIPINNRQPAVLSGTFNYADSYLLNRAIPVPQYAINAVDPTKIDRSVILRAYTYFFEHHSPSDFWGSHCRTLGRVNVTNPYERQKRLGSEIAVSKALINKSNFNGLSYFDDADVEIFNEHEWGAITGVLVENNTVLVICERDNFVVGFSDTLARINAAGNIAAPSIPDRFGKPERKLGSNYGCRKRDINTIQKRDGIVVFLDSNKAELVYHTFSNAADVSRITGTKSWVERTVKVVNQTLNDNNNGYLPYFIGGIDPKNNEYYLTRFTTYRNPVGVDQLPVEGLDLSYVNNDKDIDLAKNDTLVYSLSKTEVIFKGFVSMTPEYYGTLEGYYLDKTMIAMNRAQGYSLHSAQNGGTYNNFFGTQCKKVIVVVANAEPEEVKRFLWTEVFCKEHVFTADRVRTEAGQLSRIKLGYWQKADNFYTAPYLCDLNTLQDTFIPVATGANKLLDGDAMYGRWIETRYVSEAADDAKYCEVSAIEIHYVDTTQKSE